MQENNNIDVERCPQPKNAISQCSCSQCDSIDCFGKRQVEQLCTCQTCESSSCLFHNINIDDTKLCSENIEDFAIGLAVENLARKIIKKQIINELTTSNNEQIIKKQSNLTYNLTNPNDSEILEPKNTATTSLKEAPKAKLSDGELNMQYKPFSDKNSKARKFNAANNFLKQADMQYTKSQNHKINNFGDSEQKYDKPYCVAATSVCKETSPIIAKISAEMMNIQYKNSQNTIANTSDITNMISIINKIKEAYKACSCKVCECIVGKSLSNELCKCKPCECSDCASFKNKRARTFSERLFPTSEDECSCAICFKESCQGIGNEKGGPPCDCTGVFKNNNLYDSASFRQPCNCEPCQCIECRNGFISRQGLVAAPVFEGYQNRSACAVSAGHGLSSNPQNEISTSVNRHPQCHCEMCVDEACIPDGNQTCRCERQNGVINKPFQQPSYDYDIRRTTVSHSNLRPIKHHDTVAMYAAMTKSYNTQTSNLKKCDCNQCGCLNCKYDKITTNNDTYSKRLASANAFKFYKPELSSSLENDVYDYKSCNHQVNARHFSKLPNLNNNFGYNMSDCISRNSLVCPIGQTNHETKKLNSKFSSKGVCQCDQCKCVDSDELMSIFFGNKCTCLNSKTENYAKKTYSAEFDYPVKRGELLTPAIFKRKIQDVFIETCPNTAADDKIAKQLGILKSSMKKPSGIKSCYKPTFQDNRDSPSQKSIIKDTRSDNPMFLSSYFSETETINRARLSRYCNEMNMPKNYVLPDHFLNTSISLSKQSTISPFQNSYRDYPKTVETCLKDVGRLDSANNINLVTVSFDSKRRQENTNSSTNVQKYIGNQPAKPFSFEEPTLPKSDKTHKGIKHTKGNFIHITQNDSNNFHNTCTSPTNSDSNIKSIEYAYQKTYFNYLVSKEDYVRIQNTLQESREFSSQLLQLLDQYEKANREFESVSKKFKTPNYLIQNVITIEENINDALDVDSITIKDWKSSSANKSVEVNKNTKKINVQLIDGHQNYDNDVEMTVSEMNINSICNDTNEGRDESGDDASRIDHTQVITLTEERKSTDKSYYKYDMTKNVAKLLKNKYKRNKRSLFCSKKINVSGYISAAQLDITKSNNSSADDDISKESDKRTIFERNNDNTEDRPENFLKVAEVVDLQKHVPDSENLVIIKEPAVQQSEQMVDWIRDPWPILKKNFCHNNKLSKGCVITTTPLEKHVKMAEKIISEQPIDESATYLYKNKALIKLYSEVKKLVDLPTLQTFECIASVKKAMNHDIALNRLSKTSSSQTIQDICGRHSTSNKAAIPATISRNSCDSLKVNFLNVRQVSHHTILVKWSAPHALDNVEGYELLVDGRAVKKILSPTRCMAVVTCLHSGKVLLTVRTVVASPCPDHCPAATVIYHSRL